MPNFSFTAETREIDFDLEIRCYLYAICGTIVLISSSITFSVFTFTKEFRTKYALFNGLAIADFINGLSFVMAGIFRRQFMHHGNYFVPTTNSQCIWETPWAVLMIVAGVLPALLNLCLSMERVVALEFSLWYRRVWIEDYKHFLVLGCVLLTTLDLGFVLLLNKSHLIINSDRICAVLNSTGIVFGTVHYTVIALIFLFCFIILLAIFHKTNKSKKPSSNERRRQLLLQWITGISVVLVSIPNVALVLNEWKIPEMNPLVVGIAYCLYALHSSLSLPVYLYFRRDFRQRFFWMFFRIKTSSHHSSPHATPSITITSPKGQTVPMTNCNRIIVR